VQRQETEFRELRFPYLALLVYSCVRMCVHQLLLQERFQYRRFRRARWSISNLRSSKGAKSIQAESLKCKPLQRCSSRRFFLAPSSPFLSFSLCLSRSFFCICRSYMHCTYTYINRASAHVHVRTQGVLIHTKDSRGASARRGPITLN